MSAAYIRPDFDVVTHWVPPGTAVLDLGCGDGELLARLVRERQVNGYGVEIADAGVLASLQRGLNIVQADIEGGLNLFGDAAFDVVILSQTLQATRHTEALVNEVLRVGKSAIVTLPNFGHWQVRWQLGIGGRMPVSKRLPYQWYDTPNVHFSTIRDFDVFCAEKGITVERRAVLAGGREISLLPNLRGETAVFQIRRSAAHRLHRRVTFA
ncbi:MAG: methionine biosynthesis protein MetW [Burkholderiales bacterium]|nr:methionine biosynthesis protein MetW [Burkholderiales bacterium]